MQRYQNFMKETTIIKRKLLIALNIHYATTAKVQRSVALLHRFYNSANKNASYTIDFEVKVPSLDSVLSSLRTTGVPRHPHVRSQPFLTYTYYNLHDKNHKKKESINVDSFYFITPYSYTEIPSLFAQKLF